MHIIKTRLAFPALRDADPLSNGAGAIEIAHPAYPPINNPLLILPGGDTVDGCMRTEYVLSACSIITNNRNDGWLSSVADPSDLRHRIPETKQHLSSGTYYYHLPRPTAEASVPASTPYMYPIVPNFLDWRFPSNEQGLPEPWCQGIRHRYTAESDGRQRCRLSNRGISTHQCHIVGKSVTKEGAWFKRERMQRYHPSMFCSSEEALNSNHNVVTLRCDVHNLFDEKKLCFTPRPVEPNPFIHPTGPKQTLDENQHALSEGTSCRNPTLAQDEREYEMVAYAMEDDSELRAEWHLRPMLTTARNAVVPGEYYFARFAWTIFPLLRSFLEAGVSRRLCVLTADGREEERMYSARRCAELTRPSRSISPKRKLPDDDACQDQAFLNDDALETCDDAPLKRKRHSVTYKNLQDSGYDGSEHGSFTDSQIDIEEPMRGRKRRRSCSIT